MALKQELTATQLLQGLQKKDPRLYDLVNIIIKNVKEVQNTIDPVRTLAKSTTGGKQANTKSPNASVYEVEKRVSLRI